MNSEMEKDILKVLVTEEELKTRIAELGKRCTSGMRDTAPCFWGC